MTVYRGKNKLSKMNRMSTNTILDCHAESIRDYSTVIWRQENEFDVILIDAAHAYSFPVIALEMAE